MKVLLDIKDNKAASLMEVLGGLSYVRATQLTPYKSKVINDVREAVEEMVLIKAGKLKARNAKDLISEL